MPYPWPSLGGFKFEKDEQALWESDAGWIPSPNYVRQRPLGTASDVVTTLSIGSMERSFEVIMTPARFNALFTLLNTKVLFTDWTRPIPDSRQVFIAELQPQGDVVAKGFTEGVNRRKRRVRVTLISA